MTWATLLPVLPLVVLAAAAAVLVAIVAFRRGAVLAATATAIGLALAFAALFVADEAVATAGGVATPLFFADRPALFFQGLILLAALGVVGLAHGYFRDGAPVEEFHLLVLLATTGAATLVAASHLASVFLGLELLSVSLYPMIAYRRTDPRALEAGLKYLVMAATSSAFLVLGMAFVYAETGTMELARLAAALDSARPLVATAGVALILTGVGFKLAVVPYHLWTPDVYEGAPAPATAFIATISKGAMFALLLRFVASMGPPAEGPLLVALAVIAACSMFVGNLLGLLQTNLKRLLAYSSIAHLGYLLVAVVAGGAFALPAASFYLASYFLTTLGAFAVIALLSPPERDADSLAEYQGLFWRRPALAACLTASLLSLASIPLTAGFVAKIYLVAAGADAARWTLLFILAANSAIGVYYYLRVVATMFAREPGAEEAPAPIAPASARWTAKLTLAVVTVALVWLGLQPSPLLRLITPPTSVVATTSAR